MQLGSGLERRSGLGGGEAFAAQIRLAAIRLVAGEACGQLRLPRERGHARMSLYYGDNAQFFVLHAALGESVRVATVCTGMAWSSFVCWLVILIGAGSSEVGARSPGADVGIAFVCMS